MSLPTASDARNALPIWDGLIAYFPDVWAEIAKVSVEGAKQHHLPKLGWDTHVSTDHRNKVLRHMLDDAAGSVIDTDGCYHLAKAVWRLCAQLQLRCWERAGKDEHGRIRPIDYPNKLPGVPDRIQDYDNGRAEVRMPGVVVRCPSCGAHGGAHFGDCDAQAKV